MTELSFDARPFAEHVPDQGPDPQHPNPGSVEPGAGMIELGFYIGEHRVVLQSLKAGAFTDLFENGDPTTGRPAQSSQSSSSPPTAAIEPVVEDGVVRNADPRRGRQVGGRGDARGGAARARRGTSSEQQPTQPGEQQQPQSG